MVFIAGAATAAVVGSPALALGLASGAIESAIVAVGGTAVATSTAAGAAGGTVVAVTGAALTGGTISAEAMVVSAITGAAGKLTTTVLSSVVVGGPIGLAIVGADRLTWDCWKPVVMDNSVGTSRGITLCDLYSHPNIRQVTIDSDSFIAENIRGQQFRLSPVSIEGTLAFHATTT